MPGKISKSLIEISNNWLRFQIISCGKSFFKLHWLFWLLCTVEFLNFWVKYSDWCRNMFFCNFNQVLNYFQVFNNTARHIFGVHSPTCYKFWILRRINSKQWCYSSQSCDFIQPDWEQLPNVTYIKSRNVIIAYAIYEH